MGSGSVEKEGVQRKIGGISQNLNSSIHPGLKPAICRAWVFDGIRQILPREFPKSGHIEKAIYKVHGIFSLLMVNEKQADATQNEKHDKQQRVQIKQ